MKRSNWLMKLLMLAVVLLMPVLAFAQAQTPSPLSDTDPLWVRLVVQNMGIVVSAFGVLVGLIWKSRKDYILQRVDYYAHVAFAATENASRLTPTKVDDKAAFALQQFILALENEGIKATPEIKRNAELKWQAMNHDQHIENTVVAKNS